MKTWFGIRVLAVLATLFLAVPVAALLVRVPWGSLGQVFSNPLVYQATAVSLLTSITSALVCVVLGTSLGLWLADLRGWPATLVRAIVIVPLVMPPLVGGVALLAAYDRASWIALILTPLGVGVPQTAAAVVMGQVIVSLPFMVITVEAARRSGGVEYSRIASDLGASRWMVLHRITLPLLRPAIFAGALLCLARSLGEYGATTLFAGSIPGMTKTLPQVIYAGLQGTGFDEATGYVIAGVLVLLSMLATATLGLWSQRGVGEQS